MSHDSTPPQDQLEICFGTPTLDEMKRYLCNLQKIPLERLECSPDTSDSSSFELDDSFEAMIMRKRQELIESRAAAMRDETTSISHFSETTELKHSVNDSTFMEQDSMHKITDESFEEMERLCTLDQSKLDKNLQNVEEEEVIKNILVNSNYKDQESFVSTVNANCVTKISSDTPDALADITQLDDVEEPSCLWDNSVSQGVSKALSPVKRMHMLRPSTIIEEATINETAANTNTSKDTSHESYSTATQNLNTSANISTAAESENYRTADENSSKPTDSTGESNFSVAEDTVRIKTSLEISTENIDDEDDVVIILSSTESESEESEGVEDDVVKSPKLELDFSLQDNSLCQNDNTADPKSPIIDEIPDNFNDTMEEMEFMMRQGMKILQQKKARDEQFSRIYEPSCPTSSTKKTFTAPAMTPVTPGSPNRYLKPKQSSSSCKQTLFSNSASKPMSAPSISNSAFKKPTTNRFPLPKSAKKFDHIVSPIGAYIKKTPQTALQARIYCPNQNLIDVLHSKNQERESVMSSKENFSQPSLDPATYSSSLPRKGVVSSRGAHVLDERSAVRIPGGEKVHKLLNGSPTLVIRHEGRLRYHRETQLTDDSVADESLADLSLASGDVSVRVLKDVRRF